MTRLAAPMPRQFYFAGCFALILTATACLPALGQDQSPDDDLRVYAVNVVKKAPLEKQFTGYGIYLGKGKVITAAHVVGNLSCSHPPARPDCRPRSPGQDRKARFGRHGRPCFVVRRRSPASGQPAAAAKSVVQSAPARRCASRCRLSGAIGRFAYYFTAVDRAALSSEV